MDLNLKDKVVIVTGGAKGIGAGISESFAKEGAKLVIAGRPSKMASDFVAEISEITEVLFIEGDFTTPGICKKVIDDTVAKFGRLDVLVNNAGVNDGVNITGTVDDFRGSLEKNIVQVFELVHYALPHLKAVGGNIVNITSKVAETGQGGTSGYAASKGAMNALTREWAVEFRDINIRVNAVVPAECMTPLYENWLSTLDDPKAEEKRISDMIPLGRRMTTVNELADMTVFVASDRSSHTTGQILYVDGGYVHLDRKCTVSQFTFEAIKKRKAQ